MLCVLNGQTAKCLFVLVALSGSVENDRNNLHGVGPTLWVKQRHLSSSFNKRIFLCCIQNIDK